MRDPHLPGAMAALLATLATTLAGTLAPEQEMQRWAATTFGTAQASTDAPPISCTLRRQDHGQLRVNASVIGTPLRIGTQPFARGLGTHAHSEIILRFPAGAARAFRAWAGVDNNADTQGRLGTVEFSVETPGRELFHSPMARSGDSPLEVRVTNLAHTAELTLKTWTGADGPAHDHADWAEARLELQDGTVIWLDELAKVRPALLPPQGAPCSFIYEGRASAAFLSNWDRDTQAQEASDRVRYRTRWSDPKTGLQVTAEAAAFKDFPAVEWVLHFHNTGAQPTPLLEAIQTLDQNLECPGGENLLLDQINGDDCSERSFLPSERQLQPGERVRLAPTGGRPSNGTFPFFNLQSGEGGLFVAIGWTGQWAASLEREAGGRTRLQAGLERTRLRLEPGETIRSPRLLLLRWSGDHLEAHNTFRRLLLTHYLPKLEGQPWSLAITAQTFNRWAGGARRNWGTEAGQLGAARINRDLGCDTHWFDAGWFEGDFPNGVGNWFPKPKEFPNGLGPIGQACESLGLKFLVWYEPERVAAASRIAREHPEFVLRRKGAADSGGLFNLGDPAARRWMTDLLAGQIAQFHIHTYRNDFNMDPLPYWREQDTPDRQGMTEIRYVEGLYAMWDELRARFPRMALDDCASGGRRIDLEMLRRSIVQTRSDTACAPGRSEWDQCQAYGLNLFLPLHATIGWDTGAYECRSSATAGFCAEWDILDPAFPLDQARACIAEIKANRKYWLGDFYPLTGCSLAGDAWMAWQLHRRDLDEGIVLAWRRKDCPYSALQLNLRGLQPARTYRVQWIDDRHSVIEQVLPAAELASLELRLPTRHSSLLVRYASTGAR